jgi:hypothetical protein
MNLSQLSSRLAGAQLMDVLIAGYLDADEGIQRFRSLKQALFLVFEKFTIKLSSFEDSARLRIEKVTGVTYDLGNSDEELRPAFASIEYELLDYPDDNNFIEGLLLWDARELTNCIDCAAMRIELTREQTLFVDPSHVLGIKVGGDRLQSHWLEVAPTMHRDFSVLPIEVIRQKSGPPHEHA